MNAMLETLETRTLMSGTIPTTTVVAVFHMPLPWQGTPPSFPFPYVLGVWSALVASTVFIAAIEHGWIWYFPLGRDLMTVGVVTNRHHFADKLAGLDKDEVLAGRIAL